jgi:putative glutamine amidotransferase
MTKPKIAILLADIDGIQVRCPKWLGLAVLAAGGLPFHVTRESIGDQLDVLNPDGILLPGGFFQIPPELIDFPYVKKDLDLNRFDAYMEMIKFARTRRLPTLGICAGMQMLASVLGGKSIGKINDIENPMHGNPDRTDMIHSVKIEAGSMLHKIVGADEIDVISRHNSKMVDRFIGDFKVVARAPDGVIEAVEPTDPWNEFVLGVQWHPEKSAVLGDPHNLAIFDAFVRAAKKNSGDGK